MWSTPFRRIVLQYLTGKREGEYSKNLGGCREAYLYFCATNHNSPASCSCLHCRMQLSPLAVRLVLISPRVVLHLDACLCNV